MCVYVRAYMYILKAPAAGRRRTPSNTGKLFALGIFAYKARDLDEDICSVACSFYCGNHFHVAAMSLLVLARCAL